MDLRNWLQKVKPQTQSQPLVSQQLPNGDKITSVTEEVQEHKHKQNLLG